MRTIKFRAWDKENQNYSDWGFGNGDFVFRYGNLHVRAGPSGEVWFDDASKRFDVEQFTGLQDKNGEEIYEGDVVQSERFMDNFRGIVVWNPNSYSDEVQMVEFIDSYGKTTETFAWRDRPLFESLEDCRGHLTVIGNIHENPELIK